MAIKPLTAKMINITSASALTAEGQMRVNGGDFIYHDGSNEQTMVTSLAGAVKQATGNYVGNNGSGRTIATGIAVGSVIKMFFTQRTNGSVSSSWQWVFGDGEIMADGTTSHIGRTLGVDSFDISGVDFTVGTSDGGPNTSGITYHWIILYV